MYQKISTFLLGVVVGAVGLYFVMTYHVIRAEDGLHMVPKVSSGLGDTYVDIRDFGISEWNEHKHVAVALINADKAELLEGSALTNLRQSAQNALESLGLR